MSPGFSETRNQGLGRHVSTKSKGVIELQPISSRCRRSRKRLAFICLQVYSLWRWPF